MVNKKHNYKVVDHRGMAYVTYDDRSSCEIFIKNFSKTREINFTIKPNNDAARIKQINRSL